MGLRQIMSGFTQGSENVIELEKLKSMCGNITASAKDPAQAKTVLTQFGIEVTDSTLASQYEESLPRLVTKLCQKPKALQGTKNILEETIKSLNESNSLNDSDLAPNILWRVALMQKCLGIVDTKLKQQSGHNNENSHPNKMKR